MNVALRIVGNVGLMLAALVAPVAAQEPPAALPSSFGEVIDVRVINLEVVVTDRDGNRVSGLARDDFRLTVDGEEVSVDYFTEIRGGVALEMPEGGEAVPAILPGQPVGTSYLLFIDDYFAIGRDRKVVIKRLVEDLQLMGPEDRMAIVSYDGRKLAMISSWSQSVPELTRALESALDRRAHGLERLAEQRAVDLDAVLEFADILDDGDTSLDQLEESFTAFENRLSPEERFYAGRLADQIQRTVAAATATLRSFAAPPGRKVMLLMSGGWPFVPAEFIVGDISRPIFVEPGVSRGDDIFRPLTDTANLLGYTLYPIDVPGLQATTVDVGRAAVPTGRSRTFDSALREREQHFTLEFLAEKTGGQAYLNGRRERAFESAVADTRSYYWLGFTPSRQGDDRRHDVKVEVRDPKLKVRSRGGYLDTSRQKEVTMRVESALLFGNPPEGEPLAIQFGRPEKAGRGKMALPLEVQIPASAVTILPIGDEFVAEVELRIAVVDAEGRQADVPVIPLRIALPGPPDESTVLRYSTSVRLRRELHDVVVAIYDIPSGRIISGAAQISP